MRLETLAACAMLSGICSPALCAPATQPAATTSPDSAAVSAEIQKKIAAARLELQQKLEASDRSLGAISPAAPANIPPGAQAKEFNGYTYYIVPLAGR